MTPTTFEDLIEYMERACPGRKTPYARRMEAYAGCVGTLKHMGKTATDEHWTATEVLGGLHVVLQRTEAILAGEDVG